jgi:hypothetical protein
MTAACEHIEHVRDDWAPLAEPTCEECAREGRADWVSLRRCMSCGHVGCCDSSPGLHATAHHRATSHPMVQTLQPGQDWAWCYVDEVSVRPIEGRWVEVDLFFEAGLAYMREHVAAGGSADIGEDHTHGKGFPLGAWVAEMRRREAAGELSGDHRPQIERLPGWRWAAERG